jgi:hypothetical protein
VSVHAGAVHETALSIAGRSRGIWERLTGAPAVDGEVASIGLNPQNEVGDDMSGPPFGAAPLLPVWWWGVDSDATNARWRVNTLRSIDSTEKMIRARFWNRPHAVAVDGSAPLDRLLFSWRADADTSSSSTFIAKLRNRQTGQLHSFSRTIATTTTTTYSETTELIGVAPGLNDFDVAFVRQSGTAVLNIRSCALTVCAKRRHDLTFPG